MICFYFYLIFNYVISYMFSECAAKRKGRRWEDTADDFAQKFPHENGQVRHLFSFMYVFLLLFLCVLYVFYDICVIVMCFL